MSFRLHEGIKWLLGSSQMIKFLVSIEIAVAKAESMEICICKKIIAYSRQIDGDGRGPCNH